MSITTWLDHPEALAIRLAPKQAKSFLGARQLVVPEGCACLLEDHDERALLPAGAQRDRLAPLALLKESLFVVPASVDGLTSKDGHPFDSHVELSLYIDTRTRDAAQRFRQQFLSAEQECSASDVAVRLAPAVGSAVGAFVAGMTSTALTTPGVDEELERQLRRSLSGPLSDHGLELSRVRSARFESIQLTELKQAEAEAEVEAGKARARQRILEIWEKDRKGELLAEAEVREFYRKLEHDGQLKKLQSDSELDALVAEYREARQHQAQALAHGLQKAEAEHKLIVGRKQFDEELERTRKALEVLNGADIGALISQIADDDAKGKLYQLLIQKEMTPQQLQAMVPAELPDRLEALYGKLAQAAEQIAAGPAAPTRPTSGRMHAPRSGTTHRVLVAGGRQVLAFDPKSNVSASQPREVYELGDGDLGGIRSVRTIEHDGRRQLAVGARLGVYVVAMVDPTMRESTPLVEYPIARELSGRTGINGIGQVGDRLFASHAEAGVVAWELGKPRLPSQTLFPETTSHATSVRGLMSAGQRLFYACDQQVYGVDLGREMARPLLYSGPLTEVTSLAVQGRTLFASTVGGALFSWDLDDPHSPSKLLHRSAKIYMIRAATVGGVPHLFIGRKDRGVVCRYIEGGLETVYQSASLVRWADGADDYVFAVDYDSYQLILWRAELPDQELRRIPLEQPINDIWVVPTA